MIKIHRSPTIPKYLTEKNWERAKNNVQWQLLKDFYGKCYICEDEVRKDAEVEHLLPVAVYPEHKFDWDNLFLSCSHCNKHKGARLNIIDCCKVDPERRILQKAVVIVDSKSDEDNPQKRKFCNITVTPIDPEDIEACATAALIQDCFTKEGSEFRGRALYCLTKDLKDSLDTLEIVIGEYEERKKAGENTVFQCKTLKQLVAAHQKFAGFLRTRLRELAEKNEELAPLVTFEEADEIIDIENDRTEVSV